MIVHSILLSCFSLLGLASTASAQYQRHFQEVFIQATGSTTSDTSVQTKALDLVPEGNVGKYAFTGTFGLKISDASLRRPLLVKLGPNLPTSDPFSVEWAMTYIFPGFNEPADPSPYHLDVQDVHYVAEKEEYILCGSMNRSNFRMGGFLLRTNFAGQPILFKYYWGINILNSVVSKPNAASGYIAVGETKTDNNKNAAAILSVTEDLDVICTKKLFGNFVGQGRKVAKFNKVIRYGNMKFATVGDTTFYPKADKQLVDTDVLVAVFDEQCGVSKRKRFGHPSQFNPSTGEYVRLLEEGKSIAQIGNGLVITGRTRRQSVINNVFSEEFNDILLFRVNNNLNVLWMKHYDVQDDSDVGLAVQIRDISGVRRIFVAGTARTTVFDSTTSNDDVILLQTKVFDGEPLSAEIFGGTSFDGMSRGNVDLHLTPDEQFPLIMANTRSWPLYGINNPYLIERYDTISEKCHHTSIDVPHFEYDFPRNGAKKKNHETDVGDEKVKAFEQKVGGKEVCEKLATI